MAGNGKGRINMLWTDSKGKKPKHRQRRVGMLKEGMLLQMGTSEHDWFMGRGFHLEFIAVIDDATNEIPWASMWLGQVISLLPNMGDTPEDKRR